MTSVRNQLPYLRLITPDEQMQVGHQTSASSPNFKEQTSLFSDADTQTLGFIEVSEMAAPTFLNLLEEVCPSYVFDLRQVPIFSHGQLTRRTVFALFDALKIRYFDVAGYLGTSSPRDVALNPRLLVPNILENLVGPKKSLAGPVLFFIDPEQMTESFINAVAEELPNQNARGWEVSIWEKARNAGLDPGQRDIVFISHANPQDNDVARWFASRLAAEGYNVWSDITRLIGGEVFWDTIEDIIRNRAARVVVLLSKKGHEKPGVLDEINVAVSTERRLGLNGFVIPVRIDDLSFSSLRANIARKNAIDGCDNLSTALKEVIKALESAGVGRRSSEQHGVLSSLLESTVRKQPEVPQEQWATLVHNQIKILEWPKVLRRYNGVTQSPIGRDGRYVAMAAGPRGIFSFASFEEMSRAVGDGQRITRSGEALTESVLQRDAEHIFHDSAEDIVRSLTNLTRNAWEEVCRQRGLKPYHLSNNRLCWYLPTGFAPRDRFTFVDHMGESRTKALVGRSEAKRVFWHFGIEAQVVISNRSIRLKPHVVFSEDGNTPLDSSSRQHALRRSFCKNWWNDRWRDLLNAMLQYLANGDEEWCWPVSPSQNITVCGRLTISDLTESVEIDRKIGLIDEPAVEVGFDQKALDAREGLLLFGPLDSPRNPAEIRVGVIGTHEGIELFNRWCLAFRKPIELTNQQKAKGEIPFPGFEAVFESRWPTEPLLSIPVSRGDLLNAIRNRDRHQAVYKSVELFVEGIIKTTSEDDAQIDIWFVVIPDDVYLYGRPNSHVPMAVSLAPKSAMTKKIARRFRRETPSLFKEDNQNATIYEYHADFHHQLKARLLKSRAVTQILRESSILKSISPPEDVEDGTDEDEYSVDELSDSPVRRMQDPSNVAWNLATASFFKAGGRPWKVATARPGVCYVGLIFKRDEFGGRGHACCGAQLFLDSGEGVVFKGAMGPWYSEVNKQFHLTKEASQTLMSKVLTAFREIHGIYPREIFVHGRTRFSPSELEGFSEACFGKSEVTGVRITRSSDYKIFAGGDMPVKRGTYQKLTERVGLIWTSGYVDALGTYQGRETPNPLRVEICGSSTTDLETVLRDVMTLTKMNFNSAVFADGYPVTMRFADAIGDVLIATGDREIPPLPFRHYI